MMGRMLSLHEDIFTFHELHFFEQLWTAADKNRKISSEEATALYAQLLKNQRYGYISNKNFSDFETEAKVIISKDHLEYSSHQVFELFIKNEARLNSKMIPCEQTPRNILYLNEILELFPNAKIIAMVRDPRDVLLSQKSKWKRKSLGEEIFPMAESIRSWANYHPITISKIWNVNFSILQKKSKHPSILTVKFEDLLENPKEEMEHICQFLNITYTSRMLDVPHIGSSHRHDVEKIGISKTATGNWNRGGLAKSEIYFCQQICKKGMQAFDYRIELIKSGWIQLIFEGITFPLKLILALGLNLNRMKSIGESLSRRLR